MIDQAAGETLLVWTVRIAVAGYLVRLFVARKLLGSVPSRKEVAFWSIGCAAYLAHVILAFAFAHDWSHDAAWQHTADETARMIGVRRGEGLWLNYLFTIIWIADCVRLNMASLKNQATNRKIDLAIHSFFAFIVFNATVVFGPTMYRVLAVPVLVLFVWRTRH